MDALIGATILGATGFAAAWDLRRREIPDAIPLALVGVAVVSVATLGDRYPLVPHLAGAGIGFAIGSLGFARGVLGGGDAKLIAALGAAIGVGSLLSALAVAALVGGVFAWIALRRGETSIPYAVPLAIGVFATRFIAPTAMADEAAPWTLLVLSLAGFASAAIAAHRIALSRRAARRLVRDLEPRRTDRDESQRATPAGRWIPVLVGASGGGIALAAGAAPMVAAGCGAVPGVLAHAFVARFHERRALALEAQLAQAIQLVSAALRAGASPNDALERAARESEAPLRPLLEATSQRLRLGDPPAHALALLAERAPLEGVRLFATAVAVPWGAGGSLDRALGSVGRSLRDRVDTARRIDTQTASVRASLVAIVAANIAIAALGYAASPANLGALLDAPKGQALLASTLWLQAFALAWITRLTRRSR